MKGIGVSPGIAIGKAFVIKNTEVIPSGILSSSESEILQEIERFDLAINQAIDEIEGIKTERQLALSNEDLAILETQIELLSDQQIKTDVIEKIETEKKNANDALIEVIVNFVSLFENMDDEYMRARSADIKDVGDRILKQLNGQSKTSTQKFESDTIIIARDISPSDTITMDTSHVAGFVTQAGSKTSHTAIIAKSKGIPAVVGCGPELGEVINNDIVILDGIYGLVYINPHTGDNR